MKRKTLGNRIAIIVVIIGFVFLAVMVIDSPHLLEDPGTLDENLTVPVPEGYVKDRNDSSDETLTLIRGRRE